MRVVISGQNGFLFRGLDELALQIDRLVASAELRARIGHAAHAYVSAARRERDHVDRRLARYLAWADQARAGAKAGPRAPRPRSSAEVDRVGQRPYADSHYTVLGGGEAETALRDGLAYAVRGMVVEACATFARAERLLPGFYLPYLFRGSIDPDLNAALAALDRAEALAPTSANVRLQRGLRLETAGRRDEAVTAYLHCRDLGAHIGAADAQLGGLAAAAGETEKSARFYEAAYASNPYYVPAVVGLAQAALAARDPQRATQVLESALAHDPKMWRLHFWLGRAYGDVGRWQAAHHHLERALPEADEPAPVLALLAKSQIALGNISAASATVGQLRKLGINPSLR